MRINMPALVSLLVVGLASHASVTLVDHGRPAATLVVSPNASPQAKEAATILQEYIQRITGAQLDIAESPAAGKAAIYVGGPQALAKLGLADMSSLTPQLNEERFVIKTIGHDLALAGNDNPFYRGTVFAAYEILERLGCRWFFPGAYGEVLPKGDTLALDELNLDERPSFRFRNIWYSGWMPVDGTDAEDMLAWLDKNKMTNLQKMSLPGDNTVTRLAPADKYFQSNPEIYAVGKNGEREKEMLCLTEPSAVKIAAQTIIDTFRQNPEQYTFGFGPPDGHPQCYCERCQNAIPQFRGKGWGDPSLSDIWFKFANAVAAEVYKEFPDRWVFTNGYANRVRPPEGVGPLSPNMGIQFAMLDTCTFHHTGDEKCWQRQAYKAILDRWTRDLNCVFIYDYDPGKALDGMPFPMLHNLQYDMPYFKEHGVWGFWTEGQNCWLVTHLNYYVRARLMWDVNENVQAIVHDYCRTFYGAAAPGIEDYIWTLERCVDKCTIHETYGRLAPWRAIYTPKTLRKLDRLMQQAIARADSRPEAQHVQDFRLAHQYLQSYMRMEAAAAEGNFTSASEHADEMLHVRSELSKINDSLIPVTPEWCNNGDGALEWHKKLYQDLSEKTNGAQGRLVAMTPRTWQFKMDLDDMGVLEQWYAPAAPVKWDQLDTTLYWEAQGLQDKRGYGRTGKAWYKSSFDVPADAKGKPIMLTVGGIYSEKLWIWVNGFLVDDRQRQNSRMPFDVDVTDHIKPGETNCIAIELETLTPDRNARGGLHRRVFLWSPTATK